ncbi:MAG: hypothetical protein ABI452_06235 [Candidatus Limnocylindrales bacterium]
MSVRNRIALVAIAVLAALAAGPTPRVAAARWSVGLGTTLQIQLSGRLNPSVDATACDVDMFYTAASTVAALHTDRPRVQCVAQGVSVGPMQAATRC